MTCRLPHSAFSIFRPLFESYSSAISVLVIVLLSSLLSSSNAEVLLQPKSEPRSQPERQSQASVSIDQLLNLQAKGDEVSGDFLQKKFLTGLKNPIVSKGEFNYTVQEKLVWEVIHPFPSRLILTQNKIIQSNKGNVTFEIDARKQPFARVISNIFFDVLAGDSDSFSGNFSHSIQKIHGLWTIQLIPKSESLSSLYREIQLTTDRGRIVVVALFEISGDKQVIEFKHSGDHGED